MNAGRAIWRTLHEPRIITALMVCFYTLCIGAGGGLIRIAVTDVASWMPDALAITAGGLLIAAGIVGAPTAWRGCWWPERGAALSLGVAGGVLFVGTIMAIVSHPALVDRVVSYVSLIGALAIIQTAINRWLRIRNDPYAPGHGPVTPRRRITNAIQAMNHESPSTRG